MTDGASAIFVEGTKCIFSFVPERPAKQYPMHAAATAGCFDFGDREHWLCKTHNTRIDRPFKNEPYWHDCDQVRLRALAKKEREAEEQRAREAKAKKAARATARLAKKAKRYVKNVARALKGEDLW